MLSDIRPPLVIIWPEQELDWEKKQIKDQHAKEKAAQEELLRNPDGVDKNGSPAGKGKAARNNKKQAGKSKSSSTEEVIGSTDDF